MDLLLLILLGENAKEQNQTKPKNKQRQEGKRHFLISIHSVSSLFFSHNYLDRVAEPVQFLFEGQHYASGNY